MRDPRGAPHSASPTVTAKTVAGRTREAVTRNTIKPAHRSYFMLLQEHSHRAGASRMREGHFSVSHRPTQTGLLASSARTPYTWPSWHGALA